MRHQFVDLLPVVAAISAGVVVLLSQIVRIDVVIQAGDLLTGWAAIVAAFAVLLGLFNVLAVHLQRLARREWRPAAKHRPTLRA